MNVLVVDIGGNNIKVLATGETERRKSPSGPSLTPRQMVASVKAMTKDWQYQVVSIGYPGPVKDGRPAAEPHNLGKGWVGFDFERALGHPVRVINDAAMQALGSFKGGTMLFLGLGTGLGSCLIVQGKIAPLELAHLPYKKATYEHYVGRRSLDLRGRKRWSKEVAQVISLFSLAMRPDEIVLGGGNARKLSELPKGCRLGDNGNAFLGGFRLWGDVIPSRTKIQNSTNMKAVNRKISPANRQKRRSPTQSPAD